MAESRAAPIPARALPGPASCAWPMWRDGERANGEFCGAEVARGSYCAAHAARAYTRVVAE